jgi:2-keto-4-pentenoate hydratase
MTTPAETAARALLDARRTGRKLDRLPPGCRPADVAAAYAIQDATAAALGPVGGWKVGAAKPDAEPACAPLPTAGIMASPVALKSADYGLLGIESEIGFKLGRDLPPRGTPYTHDEVVAAIASLHPVIELVDTRYADMAAQDPLSLLADLQSHAGLVYGPARTHDLAIDQTRQPVTQSFDGKPVVERTGGNTAGDVIRLLVWLANHTAARCGGLKAGQIVTSGSCTGMMRTTPGSTVRAEFPGLGAVEVKFTT